MVSRRLVVLVLLLLVGTVAAAGDDGEPQGEERPISTDAYLKAEWVSAAFESPDGELDIGGHIEVADVDGDGKAELLVATYGGYKEKDGRLVVFEKADEGWDKAWESEGLGQNLHSITVADLNANGTPEVFVGGYEGMVFVFEHRGGSFAKIHDVTVLKDECIWSIGAGDFDCDGEGEVMAAGLEGEVRLVEWRENPDLPEGGFYMRSDFGVACPSHCCFAELPAKDNESKPIIVGGSSKLARVAWGEEQIALEDLGKALPCQLYGCGPINLGPRVSDIDGDGHVELALSRDPDVVAICRWQDGKLVHLASAGVEGGFVDELDMGDLDGDGKLEAVAACRNGHIYVFAVGERRLVEKWHKRDFGNGANHLIVRDVDGDGKEEIIASIMAKGGQIHVFGCP